MSETKRVAIRWIMCIAYAMFALAGDSLHWIPGNTCCRTSHSQTHTPYEHSHCSHGHHHHDHEHVNESSSIKWQNVEHTSHLTAEHTCPICQNLNNLFVLTQNAVLECNVLLTHKHSIDYVSVFDANLPRHSAPRGPPQIS